MHSMARKKHQDSESVELSEREQALKAEVARLKNYIQGGAEKELTEQINTMPAPDDLEGKRREAAFMDQVLSRKEIKNVRRNQAKGFVLFLLLVLAILSLSSWVYTVYVSSQGQ